MSARPSPIEVRRSADDGRGTDGAAGPVMMVAADGEPAVQVPGWCTVEPLHGEAICVEIDNPSMSRTPAVVLGHADPGSAHGGGAPLVVKGGLTGERRSLLRCVGPLSVAALAALAGWSGTLFVVSHDTDFVRALGPDRVPVLPEGQLDYFSEDLLDLVELA